MKSFPTGVPSGNDEPVVASVVITTRNRRDETLVAIQSCLAQEGVSVEVLVYDDASEDGTAEAISAAYPQVRVFTSHERTGYIVNRNRGFLDARGRYVFSIDDDAYFSELDVVARVVGLLDRDRSIGAVAIPYLEPLNRLTRAYLADPFQAAPGAELRNYIGCAHAVRRSLALELGGYREFFVHQGEERDLCLRLWAAGHRVVYGDSGHVVHMVSPKRDTGRMSHFGFRNQILFEMLNAPAPYVVTRVPAIMLNAILYRFSVLTLPAKLRALGAALLVGLRRRSLRKPVSRAVYRRFRDLPVHGPERGTERVPAAVVPAAQLQRLAGE